MKKINITTEHIQFAKNKALGVLFSELPTDSNLEVHNYSNTQFQ